MYAISIKQPFVEQILSGKKKQEFRKRNTSIRGTVYLYATKNPIAYNDAVWKGMPTSGLPLGMIIGSVDIVDTYYDETHEDWVYELANPVRFPYPRKPVGYPQPSFWKCSIPR